MRAHRLTGSTIAVLAGCAVAFAGVPVPAGAFEEYVSGGQFGETGSGNGQFSKPAGIAVDAATGDVYVADSGNNRVQKFDAQGKYLSQLNAGETPAGHFSEPLGVAVDNSSGPSKGAVYVADTVDSVVDRFDSNGKYVSQVTGALVEPEVLEPFGETVAVTIDAQGNLWVYDRKRYVTEFDGSTSNTYLRRFPTTGGARPGIAVDSMNNVYVLVGRVRLVYRYDGSLTETFGSNLGVADEGPAYAVATDLADNLYVDEGVGLKQYDPTRHLLREFGAEQLSESEGLGVSPSGAFIYASDSASNTVHILRLVTLPDVTTSTASAVAPSSVTLKGTISPDGLPVTSCEFQYDATAQSSVYDHTVPCSTVPGAVEGEVEVNAQITGLSPNQYYRYRLLAGNTNGTRNGQDEFVRTISPPTVEGWMVSALAPGAATVSGTIDSGGVRTTYRIDLGTSTAYGTSTEGEIAGASKTVSLTSLYLTPSTTYHYKITATSQDGTVTSGDQTFTTPAYPILLPLVLPQIGTPPIVFPKEEPVSKAKPRHKAKHPVKKHKKRRKKR